MLLDRRIFDDDPDKDPNAWERHVPPYNWPEAQEVERQRYEDACRTSPEPTYARSKQSARGMSSSATHYDTGDKKRRLEDDKANLTPRSTWTTRASEKEEPRSSNWIRQYRKQFEFVRGELSLDMYHLLMCLTITPTPYAPILNYRADGRYRYEVVQN